VFFSLNAVYGFTTGSSNATGSRLTAAVKRGTGAVERERIRERRSRAIRIDELCHERNDHRRLCVARRTRQGRTGAREDRSDERPQHAGVRQSQSRDGREHAGERTERADDGAARREHHQHPTGPVGGDDGRAATQHGPDGSRDGAGATRARRQSSASRRARPLRATPPPARAARPPARATPPPARAAPPPARAAPPPASGSASSGTGSASSGTGSASSGSGQRLLGHGQRVYGCGQRVRRRYAYAQRAFGRHWQYIHGGHAVGRGGHGSPPRAHRGDRFRVGRWHVVCHIERERDAGRVGYDLLLRVRRVADESELDHSDPWTLGRDRDLSR